MGYSRSSDEDRSLHTDQVELQGRTVVRDLFCRDSTSAWCTVKHCVRQRSEVYITFLGSFARSSRNQVEVEFCLSSIDGWADRKDDSVVGRFAESLCIGSQGQLG